MSDPGPYVRDALLATRAGLTDPALLVDLWLECRQRLGHLGL